MPIKKGGDSNFGARLTERYFKNRTKKSSPRLRRANDTRYGRERRNTDQIRFNNNNDISLLI